MQEIVPFDFQGNAVRVVRSEDGQPWFHGGDVCAVLGYANPRKAIADHVDSEDVTRRDTLTTGGVQQANYINESGLYALIFGSTKPEAKAFKRWVTNEVLPAIRRTGYYGALNVQESIETNLALAELLRSCMALYGALGLRGEKRLEAVRKHLQEHFGLDMDTILPGAKGGKTLTLTELGAAFGKSAAEVRALLQELGLQILKNGEWVDVDPDRELFRIVRQERSQHRFLDDTITKH
jgi:prophage antirepressor-like protein